MSRTVIDVTTPTTYVKDGFDQINTMTGEIYNGTASVPYTGSTVTLPASDPFTVYTNRGATVASVWTLPAGGVNTQYRFQRVAPYQISIKPATGEGIGEGGNDKSLLILGRGGVTIRWIVDRWEVVASDAPYNYEV